MEDKVVVTYVGHRGRMWVNFKQLNTGKVVIGQYRAYEFLAKFELCLEENL